MTRTHIDTRTSEIFTIAGVVFIRSFTSYDDKPVQLKWYRDSVQHEIPVGSVDYKALENQYQIEFTLQGKLSAYIQNLETDSFAGWSEEAEGGYKTATGSIKYKIKELTK